MKGSGVFFVVCMLSVAAACRNEAGHDGFLIGRAGEIDGLHAPWDGLDDNTSFRCFADSSFFYFLYEVEDSTMTFSDDFPEERVVDTEDRVEIFFSPGPDMERYYCAEIDPLGRVMDYSCEYYARMDYGWDFTTLSAAGWLTSGGYAVAGRISLDELKSLGIDPHAGFHMGIFRADFHPDGTVNWYSHVETDDTAPDFHRPEMLFYTETGTLD